jgi:hypothetical protein
LGTEHLYLSAQLLFSSSGALLTNQRPRASRLKMRQSWSLYPPLLKARVEPPRPARCSVVVGTKKARRPSSHCGQHGKSSIRLCDWRLQLTDDPFLLGAYGCAHGRQPPMHHPRIFTISRHTRSAQVQCPRQVSG